ncbi:mechanosensitive ion channel family protein [Bizionia argentinensis JUB59]|uniref:Mechanosensitive ion channel family protein n=1 Tax=Bizionia argentinensis JUB59 TaxID=1046627 RepID=G2EGA7_9FLAO|nr:mechanosensitive ion channel family protein [Bizionia argentinensis]EGV42491.1 mechanosensitive ion channel family protein [Bizionia argentinensis JUB59]
MIEFLNAHKFDIIFGVIVILIIFTLRFLTKKLHRWLKKEQQARFPGEVSKPLSLLKRILNTLWLVLGLLALIYLVVDESKQSVLVDNFKLALYLGVVLSLTIIAATTANMWFQNDIKKKIATQQDPTSFKFLRYLVLVSIYFIGIMMCLLAFPSLKGVAQTALGGAGVAALIVGLASQEALSNVIGGLFLIAFKPFRVGDIVSIGGSVTGSVTDITLRHTIIRTWQNRRVIIPNAVINKANIENFDLDEQKCCEYIVVGISYDSDVDLAKQILREECEKHPFILDNRTEEQKQDGAPMIRTAVIDLGDSAVVLRAWAWAENYSKSIAIKRDVFETVKKRFDNEGIEIPFPHRTVVMKQ